MAGLGRKTFVNGDSLPASEVNGYLMDQTIMRFADATARNTAIPTPSEGMVSYLQDTDTLSLYQNSTWNTIVDVSGWTTFTPTWTFTGGGSFGTGATTIARYTTIGKTVHVYVAVTLGTTPLSGTTYVDLNFPVSCSTNVLTDSVIGRAIYKDISPFAITIGSIMKVSSNVRLRVDNAASTYLTYTNMSATVPHTWASGDIFILTMTYEAA